MLLIRQLGAHHFEALGWNLLCNVLCVSQWTGVGHEATLEFLPRTK